MNDLDCKEPTKLIYTTNFQCLNKGWTFGQSSDRKLERDDSIGISSSETVVFKSLIDGGY